LLCAENYIKHTQYHFNLKEINQLFGNGYKDISKKSLTGKLKYLKMELGRNTQFLVEN